MGLRLMVYDRTCTDTRWRGAAAPVGLTHTWQVGGAGYSALGRLDAWAGASTWDEALGWIAQVSPSEPISEIQYWGHGQRGRVRIDAEALTRASLGPTAPHRRVLEQIRERMDPAGQWWFRTCDTFGGQAGQSFAAAWTEFFGCAAAGHTHVIGPWQSGLHRIAPGAAPHWSAWEGLAEGTPQHPGRSLWSAPWRPNTITCLHGAVPEGW
ncbi:MAG: DUF4347 domain-containing protein [Myxococcota bacterium]